MNCCVFRLNSIHLSRHWLQHGRVGSVNLSNYARYHQHQRRDRYLTPQQEPPLLFRQNLEGKVCSNQYHSKRQSDSSNYGRGIGILSVILGSAVLGIGSVLCEKKEEEKSEKNFLPSSSNDEKKGEDVVGHRALYDVHEVKYPKIIRKDNEENKKNKFELDEKYGDVVKKSRNLLRRRMEEAGAPGLVAAVSVDGKMIWAEGFGFADIENNVRCSPSTVMRIASISKSITMAAVAKLWEEGKLDLDAPIQKYVPYFPVKSFEGEEVTITTRHLLSHQSGIRHYKLRDPKKTTKDAKPSEKEKEKLQENVKHSRKVKGKDNKDENDTQKVANQTKATQVPEESTKNEDKVECHKKSGSGSVTPEKKKESILKILQRNSDKKKKKKEEEDEFDMKEYYIKEYFDTIEDATKLFQDDELFFKPGEGFLYTTHGWTVVSGVVEGAAGKPFTQVITQLFHDLGLDSTYLDKHSPIIHNRARSYVRNKYWKLQNAPYVDNSYKWAGGGFLSNVHDLTKFGNAMLYASQQDDVLQNNKGTNILPGFLKASTMRDLWTPVSGTNMGWDRDGNYGLGWGTVQRKQIYAFCRNSPQYSSHTGGAVGASSVLLILPNQSKDGSLEKTPPKGIVVSVITNMQGVGLNKVALHIAKLFESVEETS